MVSRQLDTINDSLDFPHRIAESLWRSDKVPLPPPHLIYSHAHVRCARGSCYAKVLLKTRRERLSHAAAYTHTHTQLYNQIRFPLCRHLIVENDLHSDYRLSALERELRSETPDSRALNRNKRSRNGGQRDEGLQNTEMPPSIVDRLKSDNRRFANNLLLRS